MLYGKIEEINDHCLIRDKKLQEVTNKQRKDVKEEGKDIISNLYRKLIINRKKKRQNR